MSSGVLLINLGTPDAPEPAAIRRYLREFLSDPRVVEMPRALWLPILYGFILPLRPRRLVEPYASIWHAGESPLLAHSRALADGIGARLGETPVQVAMRYGKPSIRNAIGALRAQDLRRLVVLPLYPQYSATTTATALDCVFDALRGLRDMPALCSVHDYHDFPPWLDALAASVRAHWQSHGRGEHLLMSFHGIPQRYVEAGDPYRDQCLATARQLAQRLGLDEDGYSVTFQSRFGRAPWTQPYTDQRLQALAHDGVRTVDAICPGFAADCLETLEEIAQRYAGDFARAGGTLRYIPALNGGAEHVEALTALLERHL